jgi:hypothetical protein
MISSVTQRVEHLVRTGRLGTFSAFVMPAGSHLLILTPKCYFMIAEMLKNAKACVLEVKDSSGSALPTYAAGDRTKPAVSRYDSSSTHC